MYIQLRMRAAIFLRNNHHTGLKLREWNITGKPDMHTIRERTYEHYRRWWTGFFEWDAPERSPWHSSRDKRDTTHKRLKRWLTDVFAFERATSVFYVWIVRFGFFSNGGENPRDDNNLYTSYKSVALRFYRYYRLFFYYSLKITVYVTRFTQFQRIRYVFINIVLHFIRLFISDCILLLFSGYF